MKKSLFNKRIILHSITEWQRQIEDMQENSKAVDFLIEAPFVVVAEDKCYFASSNNNNFANNNFAPFQNNSDIPSYFIEHTFVVVVDVNNHQ